ncbi:hypothetical protein [Streptomyces plumbiresistens]|uniref:RNA polymerase sigma factor 70 region 4 type 2 domain-containing protein n=1 Tax=Streptomyces plumbiresistens TaxID=511811 RepID=A0ABP7TJN5_9ACTN
MADLPGPRRKFSAVCPRPSRCVTEPPARPSGLIVSLPADYTAFCMLYQDRYLRYTRARVADPGLSRELVETALGSVATNWATVLASYCPAAEAWDILGSLIAQAMRGHAAATLYNTVYRVLPPLQADVVILRHRLSLSDGQAADLMGVEEPLVASQLRMAHRTMARRTAHPQPAALRTDT